MDLQFMKGNRSLVSFQTLSPKLGLANFILGKHHVLGETENRIDFQAAIFDSLVTEVIRSLVDFQTLKLTCVDVAARPFAIRFEHLYHMHIGGVR